MTIAWAGVRCLQLLDAWIGYGTGANLVFSVCSSASLGYAGMLEYSSLSAASYVSHRATHR